MKFITITHEKLPRLGRSGVIHGLDADTLLLDEAAQQMLASFEAGDEAGFDLHAEEMLNMISFFPAKRACVSSGCPRISLGEHSISVNRKAMVPIGCVIFESFS